MPRRITVALAVLAVLALAGCASSEEKFPVADRVPAEVRQAMQQEAAGGEEAGGDPSLLEFVAVDIAYESAPQTAPAGELTFELVNEGNIVHNIVIEGDGLIVEADPGATAEDTATLDAGTYTYFCDVAGHREAGMVGELTVDG